ncbi:hypothetical protein F6R98_00405 [Candidatus Methylospira mobilis]|uniref:Type VI secretion system protein TssA n=1 Tax=Candidatus Methylospira mobilis TaxID=1808979 RepID=A0A5Q0BDQ0_9GAMM|nr:type VI secretion system protein IglI family protein [Candidatus Methylospira mobilis]QFY41262.1 hypothetical protein F6R98_00405 [Candidatus Methylospira mobilis]WNV05516.1 type VI secretion system protein IglI family protein [Candidatus Methylospira mobilis]
MQIDMLLGDLRIAEAPGLDTTDPRFDEIATLAQNGDYAAAAHASEAIIAEEIYDIRLICYLLYGYWLEQGVASLGPVVTCLHNVVANNWDAIGPARNREKNVQLSLTWMFRSLMRKAQYEEDNDTPVWHGWQNEVSVDEITAILETGSEFSRGIKLRMEDGAGPVLDLWSKVVEWLGQLQRLVYKQPEPEPSSGADEAEMDEMTEENEEAPSAGSNQRASKGQFAGMEIEGSYHMTMLLKKLTAFEQLSREQNFFKAALVADEINQAIADFDPRLYFPKVFEEFIKLQAVNFSELADYMEHKESPEWQAMQDWLRVDIDGFAN